MLLHIYSTKNTKKYPKKDKMIRMSGGSIYRGLEDYLVEKENIRKEINYKISNKSITWNNNFGCLGPVSIVIFYN